MSVSQPTVSFVMPCHNAEAFVSAALDSVLAQTYADFEVLAINDGSTDSTSAILHRYTDPRVRVIDQPNGGIVASLNRGIREARGRWIARMDADDIASPNRIERQMAWLAVHPDIALLGTWVSTIDEEGSLLADVVPFPETHEEIWSAIGIRPWVMCHPAVVFRRDTAIATGLYDIAFKHAEDTEFFARLMTVGRACNLPEPLLKYRIRRTAISSAFRDHGSVNAALVRTMIDRWKPGQPFAATPAERAEADAKISAAPKQITPGIASATYHCRVGRELLRGRRWGKAFVSYARAARSNPGRVEAYCGLAASVLRAGAAPAEARRKAALVL